MHSMSMNLKRYRKWIKWIRTSPGLPHFLLSPTSGGASFLILHARGQHWLKALLIPFPLRSPCRIPANSPRPENQKKKLAGSKKCVELQKDTSLLFLNHTMILRAPCQERMAKVWNRNSMFLATLVYHSAGVISQHMYRPLRVCTKLSEQHHIACDICIFHLPTTTWRESKQMHAGVWMWYEQLNMLS